MTVLVIFSLLKKSYFQTRLSLQLYQVDQKSFLLDFKSLNNCSEPTEMSPPATSQTPDSLGSSLSIDDRMETDDENLGQPHQTLEFFEMCANLICALAR